MTRQRRFDLIAFDWDGTLFDSTMLIVRCIQAACRDIAVPVPSDADAAFVIGLGLHDALQHAVPGLPPARYPELGSATATTTSPARTTWCCSPARWRCWPT
jgi:phosphoglycolate phosphatase